METTHSLRQRQRRAIPKVIIEWLLEFGEVRRSKGADLYYFSKRSKKHLGAHLGPSIRQAVNQYLDAYLIYEEGRIITVGHRYKKIPH